jgi:hypothetical protein
MEALHHPCMGCPVASKVLIKSGSSAELTFVCTTEWMIQNAVFGLWNSMVLENKGTSLDGIPLKEKRKDKGC